MREQKQVTEQELQLIPLKYFVFVHLLEECLRDGCALQADRQVWGLNLTSYATSGNLYNFSLSLSSFICKMQKIPTSQSCCDDQIRLPM